MPTCIHVIQNKNVLYARCYGYLEPQDLNGWQVDAQISQTGTQGFVTLVDLSEVSGTDMTFEDINAIYGKLVRHYAPRRQKLTLFLFAPDDLSFGMTRIMQSLSAMTDHLDVQVFRDPENLAKYLPQLDQNFEDLRDACAKADPQKDRKQSA